MVSEELIASQNVWEPWGFYGRVVGALPGALSSFCDSLMRALPGFVWFCKSCVMASKGSLRVWLAFRMVQKCFRVEGLGEASQTRL